MVPVRIVIADDHPVVRRGVRALLEDEPSFRVLGDAVDGLEACALVERFKPDVLVLDVMMPGLGGLEVTRRVGRISPRTRVVILSMHDEHSYVREAFRSGASAYVLKRSATEELVRAIAQVAGGQKYLSPDVTPSDLEASYGADREVIPDPYERLTPREREVLQLAAEGCDRGRIAERLCISRRTAEAHRASAMRKLGLRNKNDLIRYAIKRGLISP